jgi:hypothetical protein
MLGRSDGVLYVSRYAQTNSIHSCWTRNPGGIRFGSAEIYQVLDLCFSPIATTADLVIADALVVGQPINGGADERVILFLQLPEGRTLHEDLVKRVKHEIRTRRSPRHVPARVSNESPDTSLVLTRWLRLSKFAISLIP